MTSIINDSNPSFLREGNLFFWLFFAFFLILPVYRVQGLPIATLLLFTPLCHRIAIPRDYVRVGFIGTIILGVITALNVIRNSTILLSDFSYFIIPGIYTALIGVSLVILQRESGNRRRLLILLQLYLAIQTAVALLQFINIGGMDSPLEPIFTAITVNVGPGLERYGQAHVFSERPGGLITVPTWLGMVGYLVGRFLTTYTGRYRYVIWAFTLALLSSARMALITIVISEMILFVYMYRNGIIDINLRKLLLYLVPMGVIMFFIAYFHPFLSVFLEAALSGDLFHRLAQTGSIQHRSTTYSYLFNRPLSFFIGGLVLADVPFAFDSEFVMRTLQFGLGGYIAFKLPMIMLFIRGLRFKDQEMIQMGFALSCVAFLSSLTMTTSSNMAFIVLFSVLIAGCELCRAEQS